MEQSAIASGALTITLNGESLSLDKPTSVTDLLAAHNLAGPKVAVERNLEIVPRSLWPETILADGDVLEIVHFVGGG